MISSWRRSVPILDRMFFTLNVIAMAAIYRVVASLFFAEILPLRSADLRLALLTPVLMSAIVLVLDDCVDAIVWSPEELVSIVTAISASFRQCLQMINQDTA